LTYRLQVWLVSLGLWHPVGHFKCQYLVSTCSKIKTFFIKRLLLFIRKFPSYLAPSQPELRGACILVQRIHSISWRYVFVIQLYLFLFGNRKQLLFRIENKERTIGCPVWVLNPLRVILWLTGREWAP
jgi:hypothetical protein